MATHRISLLGSNSRPLDGNSWFAPYSIVNSGTSQDPMVLYLKSAVVGVVKGTIRIPVNYVSTPVLSIVWTSETTTNDVDFKFRHRVTDGSDTELLDISTTPTELENTSLNVTGPSAASERMLTDITLTATDFVAGSTLYFEFERDGVTDTKVADITVWSLHLEYDDV